MQEFAHLEKLFPKKSVVRPCGAGFYSDLPAPFSPCFGKLIAVSNTKFRPGDAGVESINDRKTAADPLGVSMGNHQKRILQIGNYPPPMCGWAIQTKLVTEELCRRGVVCDVLKINENRQIKDPAYIDV